jgi:hypothetical protein
MSSPPTATVVGAGRKSMAYAQMAESLAREGVKLSVA